MKVAFSVGWCAGRVISDGVVSDIVDELNSDTGDKFGKGFELEVGGKVVSIYMSKMKHIWILITMYIEILTEVFVMKLLESVMLG